MTLIPFPRLAPAAGLAMLLAGCTSPAPPPATPDPALPAHFDAAPSEPAGPAVGDDWQAFFTDARLQARIRQALAFNRDLRGAMLQVAEARAAYGIRRGEPLPAVGLGAGGMRERVPADLSLTRHTSYGTQYQAGLGIASWELDFWGRMASLEEAALQQYFASVEVRQAATLSLIAQVAQTHLLLQELDERLRLARRTVASRAESRRIVARRVEVGAASRLSLTQVDTLLNQAEVLAAQLEQARAQQAHAMRLLTGETEPAASDTPEAPLQLGSAPRAGLPSELLLRRPDLLAAEHRLRAAQAQIGAARAAFFPSISLTALAGTASTDLSRLLGASAGGWAFMPSLTLPLFDGQRRRNSLTLAEARRDEAVAAYEKAVQNAFREVSDALSTRHWLGEQLALARDAVRIQRERTRLSERRLDVGATTSLELLDAQRDLLAAEQQEVQLRRALASSEVALYAALGGGVPRQDTAGPAAPRDSRGE